MMTRALVSVTTIRQLIDLKMIPGIGLHRNLACFHRAVGGVRWKSSLRQSPHLTVTPIRALIDEQVTIKGRFLPPHCPVTMLAQMHSDDGDLWEAFAHYNTNAHGTVNLSRDHSVGGSYLGCEPMGLFWGLQPAPGGREGLRLRKKNVETPYVMHVSLLEGHVSPKERQSTELAAVTTERWYMAPGVQRTEIRQDGIVGTLFLPPGPGPFPAMLDLWGMGGGLIEYRSALLASRGFASLALAYFDHKDLPGPQSCINVGDSYFKSAVHLLQKHHQICADRIGFIGLSFGVYLTLRLASQPGINPSCLICVNGPTSAMKPSDLEGRTEDADSSLNYWMYERGYVRFRNVPQHQNLPLKNTVKIEKINCPVMYVMGEDDQSSTSRESADELEEKLTAAGKSHLFSRLSYPGAGHLIEPPYTPNSRISLWRVKPQKLFSLWGGQVAPHAAAQEDAWTKILDFMDRNLRN